MKVRRFFEKKIMKQFRLVLCCLLAMGVILSVLCFVVIEQLMTSNAAAYAQTTAQRFNLEVEHLFKRVDAMFNDLLFDENIEQMMYAPFSERTPAYLNALNARFSSYRLMNQSIAEIALVTPEMSWSGYFDNSTLQQFREEMADIRSTVCFGLKESPLLARAGSEERRLIFGHNVYGMYNNALYGMQLGTIILSLNLSESSIQLPPSDRTDTYFLLMDQNGAVFPFNCDEEKCQSILEQGLSEQGGSWPTDTFQTKDYLIASVPLNNTGLRMVSAMDRHALNREALPMVAILSGVTAISLIWIVFLMRLMLQSVVRPISQLSEYIQQIRSAKPGAEIEPPAQHGCEEIVRLSRSFNTLLSEQARLTRELQQATVNLYETQLGRKQAELEYLRSQINPHFLYNTLEAIQGIAVERGVPQIADATGALGKLFRHSVQGGEMALFSKELEVTQAYLTIQKLRFSDKLNVIISVRENTKTIPVMKLLLQPIVENAVYHGLEPKAGLGTLFIGARVENGDLLISVYDDGVGMTPERLEELQKRLEHSSSAAAGESGHIGLLNVQHRIRLHYGAPYGLTVQSALSEGTRVVICVPASPHREEDGPWR